MAVERDRAADGDSSAVVDGMNAFAFDLLRELRADGSDNVVVSPYSIVTALGMVYGGARGTTATEMAEVLGYPDPGPATHAGLNALALALEARAREGITLATANQVWVRPGLGVREKFGELLNASYGAPVASLDFSSGAEELINGWVSDQTNDRIEELFAPGSFDASTAMVLANAVYLDATWQRPFEEESTSDGTFTRPDGSEVTVPMMQNNRELPSGFGSGWAAVELPYAGDELSMVVVVPQNITAFEERLSPELLEEITGSIRDGGIHFSMPKVSLSYQASLPKALGSLGMTQAFGTGADFSGMAEGGGLRLDQVEHEVFLAIDEEGTEAAAATGAVMADSHGPTVMVNQPYVVVIRDKPTGAVLFVGTITDPSVKPKS